MELNVNSPAYFKDHFGIDDEVYNFFQKAYQFFLDKEYSDTLHIIGITPIVAPQELYENGAWEESVRLVGNKSCAIISARMDFEEYYKADSVKRICLIKSLVLKFAKKVKSRVRFDYEKFEQDFNSLNID